MLASRALAREYSGLSVLPVHADFAEPIELPRLGPGRRLGFFPGSTIGNLTPDEAIDFLHSARRPLGPGSLMFLCVVLNMAPNLLVHPPFSFSCTSVSFPFALLFLRFLYQNHF